MFIRYDSNIQVLNPLRRINILCRNYVRYCMLFKLIIQVNGKFVQTKKIADSVKLAKFVTCKKQKQ